ncbi:MAG: hypothetical protein M1825_005426 [Sarcosagium campestre]|nr:MAG: hypothetical protein M1825_005426 [Sarcosagium campestre]
MASSEPGSGKEEPSAHKSKKRRRESPHDDDDERTRHKKHRSDGKKREDGKSEKTKKDKKGKRDKRSKKQDEIGNGVNADGNQDADKKDRKKKTKRKHHDETPHNVPDDTPTANGISSTEHYQQPLARIDSPFHVQTASLYVPLSPISQLQPLDGLCAEHLSPLLLTYYGPFRAVILSYSNARLSEHPLHAGSQRGARPLGKAGEDLGISLVWLTADFLLFKPGVGDSIQGFVNLQDESHLGLVCWNLFNASIERKRLPADWTWAGLGGAMSGSRYGRTNGVLNDDEQQQEEPLEGDEGGELEDRGEGYYMDGDGNKIEGTISFRIKDTETSFDQENGFLSLEGTMLDEDTENALVEEERARRSRKGRQRRDRRFDGPTQEGQAGNTMTIGLDGADDGSAERERHRITY